MKNKIFLLGAFSIFSMTFAQINLTTNPDVLNIPNGTPFLDASSAYDERNVGDNNVGKGLVFPRVDLTNFEFNTDQPDGANVLPTYYDGMIVYNVGKGTTLTGVKRSSTATDVIPGFYYFSNPGDPSSVTTGKWIRIGSGSANNSKVVLATNGAAVDTNTVIGSTTVKAVKNSINHTGGNSITINKPSGFTKLYSIKIYKVDGKATTLVGTNLYSYADEGTDKLKLVFGNGIISTSYPKGEYEYVLEYL